MTDGVKRAESAFVPLLLRPGMLSHNQIDNIIHSMPQRLEALQKARRWHKKILNWRCGGVVEIFKKCRETYGVIL
jgi:hypothetical protein